MGGELRSSAQASKAALKFRWRGERLSILALHQAGRGRAIVEAAGVAPLADAVRRGWYSAGCGFGRR
jgi:hypothetical protein